MAATITRTHARTQAHKINLTSTRLVKSSTRARRVKTITWARRERRQAGGAVTGNDSDARVVDDGQGSSVDRGVVASGGMTADAHRR